MYAENVYERWIQSLYGICLSARWTHTPLSFKRGVWLSIMDGGPPGVYLTAYYDRIMHVIYLDIKQARFSICLLNSTVIQLAGVILQWSLSGDLWAETGAQQERDFAAGSGGPCCLAARARWAMCLCWCCVCLRLRTSTGQRTTTAPSIMALFQLVISSFLKF